MSRDQPDSFNLKETKRISGVTDLTERDEGSNSELFEDLAVMPAVEKTNNCVNRVVQLDETIRETDDGLEDAQTSG